MSYRHAIEGRAPWHLAPTVALRIAGFPLAALDGLRVLNASGHAARLSRAEDEAVVAAGELSRLTRAAGLDPDGQIRGSLRRLKPLPECVSLELESNDPNFGPAIDLYQRLTSRLWTEWTLFDKALGARIFASRNTLLSLFQDNHALREVLLLSNSANYSQLVERIDRHDGEAVGRNTRRLTDLLVMYLQRVAAKNDTHAHFGPVTGALIGIGANGVSWEDTQPLRRVTFFTHWAGELLGDLFANSGLLADSVRPRRAPLTFFKDGHLASLSLTRRPGVASWEQTFVGEYRITPAEMWLLRQCDGSQTRAELRQLWILNQGSDEEFGRALERLVKLELIRCTYEVPVGDPYPLRALRDQLPAADAVDRAKWAHDLLLQFEESLKQFNQAKCGTRAPILQQIEMLFEEHTAARANRGHGQHYADRAVIYEECHGPLAGVTLGPDLAGLLTQELSIAYDLALVGSRLQMTQEKTLLAKWMKHRFGEGVRVALGSFYDRFYADRANIAFACASIEREAKLASRRLTEALLEGVDTNDPEVELPRDRIKQCLDDYPARLPAVCNPDVMLAARDVAAVAAGDFLAVVGECHAVREALTHTSFSPLLDELVPSLARQMAAQYRRIVGDAEELCDVCRTHPDKTSAQLQYPFWDLEVVGRSPKARSRTLQPSQLYVVTHGQSVQLHAEGVERPLRLLAPPAGGRGLLSDPLSVFAFPRHFGGPGLETSHLNHVPRLRTGRVILHRETWRVDTSELRGILPGQRIAHGDAASMYAAHRLRERLRLPRRLYARIPGQPKPIYVDLDGPLLVRQLFRHARNVSGTVTLSEMLPGPDHLWLDIEGQRHTCEIRCAVFSAG